MAALNLVALSALQVIPVLPALAQSDAYVLGLATTIVGVQVGQTVTTQVLLTASPPRRPLEVSTAVFICALPVLLVPGRVVTFAVLTTCGLVLGASSAVSALPDLVPGRMIHFQTSYLVRNVAWVLVVALTCALSIRSLGVAVAGMGAVVFALGARDRRRRPAGQHVDVSPALPAAAGYLAVSAVLGVGSSLVYRNDVNLLRARSLHATNFTTTHYELLLYSTLNAAAGFIVLQFLYPRLRARGVVQAARSSVGRQAWATGSTIVGCLVVSWLGSLVGGVAGLVLAACALAVPCVLTTLYSARLHASGRSAYVYVAGVASVGALLAVIDRHVLTALLVENVTLLALLGLSSRLPSVRMIRQPVDSHA